MDTSWSSTLLTSCTSLGCRVHLPAWRQAKLDFSKISRREASAPLLRAWMASLVKCISTSSWHNSLTSLAKGAKGMRSSNDFWSFLISWRAVRGFGFQEGSLVFTVLVELSLNSFQGHFLAAVGNRGPATGGGVPEIKTVSTLTCGVETTGVSSAGTAFSSWMHSS